MEGNEDLYIHQIYPTRMIRLAEETARSHVKVSPLLAVTLLCNGYKQHMSESGIHKVDFQVQIILSNNEKIVKHHITPDDLRSSSSLSIEF